MRCNHLLASPTFAAWLDGEPLEINRLLTAPDGRPRISILSIAHLGESERMFFVTTLLNEMVGVGALAVRHLEPARAALHGRDLRLLPAHRDAAVEEADAHPAQAGAGVGPRRRAGDAEPSRPRLQGPRQHRHLVPGPAADRARQAARARRTGGRRRRDRGGVRPAGDGRRCWRGFPVGCSSLTTCTRTRRCCSRRGGRCRTCAGRSSASRSSG